MIHDFGKSTRANRHARSPIRACVFDLDGVLVDSARYHYLAWRRLAATLGFELRPEDNESLKGVSRMACVDIILGLAGKRASEAEKVELAERKNRWYREYVASMDESSALPGARDFVAECRGLGLLLAVASASKNAIDLLRATTLAPLFDAVVDGNEVATAKPDPAIFLAAARKLDVVVGACLVFEDAAAGVEAARAAGMRVVGVGAPAVLAEADLVVPGFEELSAARLLVELGGR
jgi:beta-phosphoglucomutase